MKKGTFVTLLALSLAAIACQREQADFVAPFRAGEELTFTATIDGGAETRTSLNGTKIMWNASESINIFYGASETGSQFVSSNTEPSQSVAFSGTISAFTGTTGDGEPLSFWAVYPYNEDDSCTGSSVSANLPATQYGVENNIPDNAMMMVAKTPGLALSFKQVCSRLRIRIFHPDITKIVFCGNAGEVVAGRATIAMDASGNPEWTAENGATEIELLPDGEHFVNGSEYYLVLYPQDFEDGITIKFYRDELYGEIDYDEAIEFERNGRNTFNSSEVDVWENPEGVVPVSSVSLNKATLTLAIGKTETLTATVLPSDATDPTITWVSSNTAVATVSSSGLVTAVSVGTATITAWASDGIHFATCEITVTDPQTEVVGEDEGEW